MSSYGMKYIAYYRPYSYTTLLIFASDLNHYQVANSHGIAKEDIIGAGFIKWDDSGPYCYGSATSLGVNSRGEADTVLLKQQMARNED